MQKKSLGPRVNTPLPPSTPKPALGGAWWRNTINCRKRNAKLSRKRDESERDERLII